MRDARGNHFRRGSETRGKPEVIRKNAREDASSRRRAKTARDCARRQDVKCGTGASADDARMLDAAR